MKTKIAFFTIILAFTAFVLASCGKNDTPKTDTQKDTKTETSQNTEVKKDQPVNTETKTQEQQKKDAGNENVQLSETSIKVPTVQCDQCKKNLTRAFKKATGVENVDIDIDGKVVKVKYDKSKTDLDKLEKTITAAGYDANDKKADKDAYDNLDDCCKLPKDRKK